MRRGLLLFALSAWMALPVLAGSPLPGQKNTVVAEFTTAPTTVVADVVDVTDPAAPSQVGTNIATVKLQVDAVAAAFFAFDLATVTGYPTDCTPKSYLVRFTPDAADCAEGVNPKLCASTAVQVGGSACAASQEILSEDVAHTTVVVSAQGISQAVLNFYANRGLSPVKWRKMLAAADGDFATPDRTLWEVYFYTDTGQNPRVLCTVITSTDPSSALPSSAHCAGA